MNRSRSSVAPWADMPIALASVLAAARPARRRRPSRARSGAVWPRGPAPRSTRVPVHAAARGSPSPRGPARSGTRRPRPHRAGTAARAGRVAADTALGQVAVATRWRGWTGRRATPLLRREAAPRRSGAVRVTPRTAESADPPDAHQAVRQGSTFSAGDHRSKIRGNRGGANGWRRSRFSISDRRLLAG